MKRTDETPLDVLLLCAWGQFKVENFLTIKTDISAGFFRRSLSQVLTLLQKRLIDEFLDENKNGDRLTNSAGLNVKLSNKIAGIESGWSGWVDH